MSHLSVSIHGPPPTAVPRREGGLHFSLQELSGSLGDLGTFLPLTVALTLSCGMDLGLIFIFAGLMNVLTGLWFRQPIPVQPMKAIAVLAIAGGLSAGEIAAAGMLTGLIVLALALAGGVNWITRAIPKPVVRGIQVGVGLKLAWEGVAWLGTLPAIGWDSWFSALMIGVIVALSFRYRQPVLLYLFVMGFGLLWLVRPDAYQNLALKLPAFYLIQPGAAEWWGGLTRGAIPQLPLTLLNSVVAVCALSADCFPGNGIAPRRMAASVGLMNLLCAPLGGMPMCHGAGGLAAQYRFGARTGGSVIMLGAIKILVGLLMGASLGSLLVVYPRSILAIMVLFAGVSLAAPARDCIRGTSVLVLLATTLAFVLASPMLGVGAGLLVAGVCHAVVAYRGAAVSRAHVPIA
jgi:MFS superfamily sulfate permease-like transporter